MTTEPTRYSGATIARSRAIKNQKHNDDGHDDDESDVVVVIVTRVPEHSRESRHRYRGVRQRGIGLSPPSGSGDRIDLIHCFGAERIEPGLDQVPHRVPVWRYENLGGLSKSS